jgi:hypothetical protein
MKGYTAVYFSLYIRIYQKERQIIVDRMAVRIPRAVNVGLLYPVTVYLSNALNTSGVRL